MEGKELARQLCVQVGMIMEDASVGAISTRADISVQVSHLKLASDMISALVIAAEALVQKQA